MLSELWLRLFHRERFRARRQLVPEKSRHPVREAGRKTGRTVFNLGYRLGISAARRELLMKIRGPRRPWWEQIPGVAIQPPRWYEREQERRRRDTDQN